jgi:hypothetical protein
MHFSKDIILRNIREAQAALDRTGMLTETSIAYSLLALAEMKYNKIEYELGSDFK